MLIKKKYLPVLISDTLYRMGFLRLGEGNDIEHCGVPGGQEKLHIFTTENTKSQIYRVCMRPPRAPHEINTATYTTNIIQEQLFPQKNQLRLTKINRSKYFHNRIKV